MNFVIPFCFVYILSAHANQVTVPVQQYPTYEQSVYNSPTVPVVYQTAATSYSNPCALYSLVQNTIPKQIANSLVTKVLSNPTIHNILDPELKFYNPNAVDSQKPLYNPVTVPNIVNNYFIVPPDFLKFNESELSTAVPLPNIVNNGDNHNTAGIVEIITNTPQPTFPIKENLVQVNQDIPQCQKSNQINTPCRKVLRKKARKRIRSKFLSPHHIVKENASDIITSNSQNQPEENYVITVPEELINIKTQKINGTKSKVKEKPSKRINPNKTSIENDRKIRKKSKKRKKSKTISNSPSTCNTEKICNDNIDNIQVVGGINSVHELETDINVSIESTAQDSNKNHDQNVADFSRKELDEKCFADLGSLITCLSESDIRVTRNSQDDEIWREFRQSFPDVPETLARNMLSFVQSKYQNQYRNNMNSLFYFPDLPYSYDHLYQMPYMHNYGKTNVGENRSKIKSKRRKHKTRKVRNKKRNDTSNKIPPKLSDNINANTEESVESTTENGMKTENLITQIMPTMIAQQVEDVVSETATTMLPIITEVLLTKTEATSSAYDTNEKVNSKGTNSSHKVVDIRYHENIMPTEETINDYDDNQRLESEETLDSLRDAALRHHKNEMPTEKNPNGYDSNKHLALDKSRGIFKDANLRNHKNKMPTEETTNVYDGNQHLEIEETCDSLKDTDLRHNKNEIQTEETPNIYVDNQHLESEETCDSLKDTDLRHHKNKMPTMQTLNHYDDNQNLQSEETHGSFKKSDLKHRENEMSFEETLNDYDGTKKIKSEETDRGYEGADLGYNENEMPELGEEDVVPIIYTNGLIDDYYPTFTDNAFYANNNEFTVADVNDRYYYTTDRNIDFVGRDSRKLESLKASLPIILKQSFKDTVPKHTYFDVDRESYKNLIKEIIQPKSQFKLHFVPKAQKDTFKIPPALENPDFRTKRIYKDSIIAEDYRIDDGFDDVPVFFDYNEKSSIYSNAKTPFYNDKGKPYSEMSYMSERPVKSNGGAVETLFARSKVAKYGVDNENIIPELTTIKNLQDDEICVVTAQSLNLDEVW